MITLYNALSDYIERVKELPEDIVFAMDEWDHCVIGRTTGWGEHGTGEEKVLNTYFGINLRTGPLISSGTIVGRFSYDAKRHYTSEQWDVIRLFTSAIGDAVSVQKWLELAEDQLSEMNSGE